MYRGMGLFLSGRPGEFMSRHGPCPPPPPSPCSCPLRPRRQECFLPPPPALPVRFIGVAITRKFQFILPARPSTFHHVSSPRPRCSPEICILASGRVASGRVRPPTTFYNIPDQSALRRVYVFLTAENYKIRRSEFFVNTADDEICREIKGLSDTDSAGERGRESLGWLSRVNFCCKLARHGVPQLCKNLGKFLSERDFLHRPNFRDMLPYRYNIGNFVKT